MIITIIDKERESRGIKWYLRRIHYSLPNINEVMERSNEKKVDELEKSISHFYIFFKEEPESRVVKIASFLLYERIFNKISEQILRSNEHPNIIMDDLIRFFKMIEEIYWYISETIINWECNPGPAGPPFFEEMVEQVYPKITMKDGIIYLSNVFEDYSLDDEKLQFKTVQNISSKYHNVPRFEPIRFYSEEELIRKKAMEKARKYYREMMSKQRWGFKKGEKVFKCANCKTLIKADDSNCYVCGFRTDYKK